MNIKSRLSKVWCHSLWVSGPLAVVLTIWLVLGWQRFAQLETAVQPEHNAPLTDVLSYQAHRLLVDWMDKSSHIQPKMPPFLRPLQLRVAQRDLKALDSDLPQSGKVYVRGRLLDRQNEFKIKLRYRGNSPLHWRGDKKSMRVRLVNDKLWHDMDTFELLAPNDPSIMGSYLGAKLAQKMNLLAPKMELAWLYLNGESRGFYTLVETIDEQTLINQAQMPGDIYSGEVAKRDAFVGADNRLFYNAGLWQKLAFNSDYPQTSKAPLELLSHWLVQQNVDYRRLSELVDYPSFARFHLFHQLLQSTNIDQHHNWRLYFDHSRGRFFPIVWDPEGWQTGEAKPQQGRLLTVLLADPKFNEALKQQFKQLQMPQLLQTFLTEVQQMIAPLKIWVEVDPYRSIDLDYYDSGDFGEATTAMLATMKTTFKQSWPEPEAPKSLPTEQVWQGEKHFEGVNHIRYPVTIEAGSRLLMGPGSLLVFHQKLSINGTPQARVEITSSTVEPFGAVVIKGDKANGSSLSYCNISNGSSYKNPVINYTAMLSLHEVEKVTISHCRFADNQKSDDMVHGVYADMTITDSIFKGAVADGLDLEISKAVILQSYFSRNGREGIDMMRSDVVLRDVHFIDNLDSALSVGQKSRVRLENSVITGSKTAILVKDSSVMRVTNSDLFANERIVELKHSNDHYAQGGLLYVYRSKLYDNRRFFDVEKNSKMTISDSYLTPRFSSDKKRIQIDVLTDNFESRQAKGPFKLNKSDAKHFQTLDQKVVLGTVYELRGRSNDQP